MDFEKLPQFSLSLKFKLLGILVLNYIFNYLFNVYLAHHYPPHLYGQISLVLMVLIWIIPFVLLGTNLSSIRFLPEYLVKRELDKFYGFQNWAIKILYYSSIVLCIIFTLLIIAEFIFEDYGFELPSNLKVILFSFWLVPLFALSSFQSSILMSLQKRIFSQAVWGLYPLLATLILMFFSLFIKKFTLYHAFISLGFALVIIVVAQRLSIMGFFEKSLPKPSTLSTKDKTLWRHVSLHLMLNSIIFIGITTVDMFLLAFLSKNKEVIGQFSVLSIIIGVFWIIQNVSASYLSPIVAPLIKTEQHEELQSILNKSFLFRFFISAFFLVIILIFGENILALFGNFYSDLYYYLLPLAISCFVAINISYGMTLLTLTGHHRIVTKVIFLQLVWLITFNLILIPKYHLAGVLFSMCTGLLIPEILGIILVRHYTKLKLLVFL